MAAFTFDDSNNIFPPGQLPNCVTGCGWSSSCFSLLASFASTAAVMHRCQALIFCLLTSVMRLSERRTCALFIDIRWEKSGKKETEAQCAPVHRIILGCDLALRSDGKLAAQRSDATQGETGQSQRRSAIRDRRSRAHLDSDSR